MTRDRSPLLDPIEEDEDLEFERMEEKKRREEALAFAQKEQKKQSSRLKARARSNPSLFFESFNPSSTKRAKFKTITVKRGKKKIRKKVPIKPKKLSAKKVREGAFGVKGTGKNIFNVKI